MGKRCDFSARTVITGDPTISCDQVIININIIITIIIIIISISIAIVYRFFATIIGSVFGRSHRSVDRLFIIITIISIIIVIIIIIRHIQICCRCDGETNHNVKSGGFLIFIVRYDNYNYNYNRMT